MLLLSDPIKNAFISHSLIILSIRKGTNHGVYFVNDLSSAATDLWSESQVLLEVQHYFCYRKLKMVKNFFFSLVFDTEEQSLYLSQVPPHISTMDIKTFLPPALRRKDQKKKRERERIVAWNDEGKTNRQFAISAFEWEVTGSEKGTVDLTVPHQ